MTPFEPFLFPLRWSRVSRVRYVTGMAAWAASLAAAWSVSGEPWPTALRTVLLIHAMGLSVDGVRYWRWSRRRPKQDVEA